MTRTNFIQNIFNRMTVLILSFGLCVSLGMAQNTLSEKLTHVLDTRDIEAGIKLYNEITDIDLQQLPDSTLFNYHYLAGYINSEISDHEKAIRHLTEAKRLCDTSLGTHSGDYMEVMRGLGDEFLELRQHEEALAIYQEGIVKSMYMRSVASHDFGNLIMGVQNCYERMGKFNEIPRHLYDAWTFWNRDEKPVESYTYHPLWTLQNFYHKYGMNENALQVCDYIINFITEKENSNYPEIAKVLFCKGSTLIDLGRNEDAIEVFRQGLFILNQNNLAYESTYEMLISNLLTSLVSVNRTNEVQDVLGDIKSYSERIDNSNIYKNALYSVVKHYNAIGNYTQALYHNNELTKLSFTEQELPIIDDLTKTIESNNEITAGLSELENLFETTPLYSDEWYGIGYKLSCAYFLNKNQVCNLNVLKRMHDCIVKNKATDSDYYLWTLSNLHGACFDCEEYEDALHFAQERLSHLYSIKNIPDYQIYVALNNMIVAKLKTNHIEDIDTDIEKERVLCEALFGKESSDYATYLHNRGRAFQLQGKLEIAKATLLESINLQNQIEGKPTEKTVKYYLEVDQQLGEL